MADELKQAIKEKKKLLLATLQELPAFSLDLKWELGSSVPGGRGAAGRGGRRGVHARGSSDDCLLHQSSFSSIAYSADKHTLIQRPIFVRFRASLN